VDSSSAGVASGLGPTGTGRSAVEGHECHRDPNRFGSALRGAIEGATVRGACALWQSEPPTGEQPAVQITGEAEVSGSLRRTPSRPPLRQRLRRASRRGSLVMLKAWRSKLADCGIGFAIESKRAEVQIFLATLESQSQRRPLSPSPLGRVRSARTAVVVATRKSSYVAWIRPVS